MHPSQIEEKFKIEIVLKDGNHINNQRITVRTCNNKILISFLNDIAIQLKCEAFSSKDYGDEFPESDRPIFLISVRREKASF